MTAVAYLLLAFALDLIPGVHVGGADRAMPKVAHLCNLVAGIVGGGAAFLRLTHHRRSAARVSGLTPTVSVG